MAEAKGKTSTTEKTTEGLSTDTAQTVQEAGETAHEVTGKAYEDGYFGYVPSKDPENPVYEDLTLAGVIKRQDEAKAEAAKNQDA